MIKSPINHKETKYTSQVNNSFEKVKSTFSTEEKYVNIQNYINCLNYEIDVPIKEEVMQSSDS